MHQHISTSTNLIFSLKKVIPITNHKREAKMGSRETKMAHAEYRKVRGLVLDFEADNERRKLRGTGLTPPLPNNRPSAF